MTLEGTVTNGMIALAPPGKLPEAMRVPVVVEEPSGPEPKPPLLSLLKLAGTAKDLPADFAAQHDHYLHGTPKR